MGNIGSCNQEEISQKIQEEYQKQSNQFLIHKKSQMPCTLHKIQTRSTFQQSSVIRNIQEYKNSQCRSISTLREHYKIENGGYCSDQQYFYLIFKGQNTPTVKQEFLARRYNSKSFSSLQIQSILAVMLCGLRQYCKRFNRSVSRISLQSIGIDNFDKNHMYLKDPWLSQKQAQSSQSVNFVTSYPSPQKLHAVSNFISTFDQFKSNLFTIGVFGLQLSSMNFKDQIYSFKKFIDRNRLNQQLNLVKDTKLRSGLQILLSQNPNERQKIYNFWNIKNQNVYCLSDRQGKLKANFYKESSTDRTMATNHIEVKKNTQPIQRKKLNSKNTPNTNQSNTPSININQHHPIQPPNITYNNFANSGISATSGISKINNQNINKNKVSINMNIPTLPVAKYKYQQITKGQQKINKFKKQVGQCQNTKKTYRVTSLQNKINVNFTNTNKNKNKNKGQNNSVDVNKTSTTCSNINKNVYKNAICLSTTNNKNNEIVSDYKTPNFDYRSPSFKFQSDNNKRYQVNFNRNQQPIITNSFGVNSTKSQFNIDRINQNLQQSIISTNNIFNDFSKIGLQKPTQYQKKQEIKKLSDITQSFGNPSLLTHNQSQSIRTSVQYPNHLNNNQLKQKEPLKSQQKIQNIQNQQNLMQSAFQSKIHIQIQQQQKDQLLQQPQSPSTIQVTPPPPQRHPNKYNSTIVQVNQQTPNDSQNSQNQGDQSPRHMQFVVQEYETGSKYEGYKKNNVRNGRGKFFYQDGGYYDGQWKNNQMHGWGKLFYEGGKLAYQGNWAHDQFHGYGKVYNDNPLPIRSTSGFDYTNFDLLDDYWQHYEGMLVTDTKQGRGKIQLTNGQTFEGDFHNDRIQGFGKFTKLDGSLTQGIWRDSRLIKVLSSN